MFIKKLIALVLSFITITMLVSCNSNQAASQGDVEAGVTITLDNSNYSNDNKTLLATWKNNLDTEIMFGEEFKIEQKVNNSWNLIEPKDNIAFDSIGYSIQTGGVKSHEYQINTNFGDLKSGDYRLVASYTKDKASKDIYAEFTVK